MAGWSKCSEGVIGTRKSDYGEGYLRSGERFDDVHGALAEGTRPGGRVVRGRSIGDRRWLVEQAPAERPQLFAGAVGEPAEVPDAGEASGQDVL